MEIRRYRPEYLTGVIRVWEHASRVGHPFLTDEFLQSERKNIPAVYLTKGETWVALDEESVIGFTILHGNEVGALFVAPDYHGQGVGYALMNLAHEMHQRLSVDVFKANKIGTNFYLRYGFQLVREYFHEESGMTMLHLEYEGDV